jgi:parallel beta-helix repeat protein
MLMILIPVNSESAIIQVPSNYDTIGQALDIAAEGDTILLANSSHKCTETILIDKDVRIESEGSGCTIVFQLSGQLKFFRDENNENNVYSKLKNMTFMNAGNTAIYCENASPEFESCTFTKNNGDNGGAVYCKKGHPIFKQCVFSENIAQKNGGAMYLDEKADATFDECILDANKADANGGGIFIHKASPSFSNNYIKYNSADAGGGIYVNESKPSFAITRIESNTATTNGGGIFISNVSEMNTYQFIVINNSCSVNGGGLYVENTQDITLEGLAIDSNSANDGAGIYFENSYTPVIQQCQINGNDALNNGGAIYLNKSSRPVIQQCQLYGNDALNNGGAIYLNKSSAPVIQQCQINGNDALNNGGAIYLNESKESRFVNLLVSENKALDGGGVYFNECDTGSDKINDCDRRSNIIFCTFARNISRALLDTGIVYFFNTSACIVNSILWNEGYVEIESNNIDLVSVTYSDVEVLPYTDNVFHGEGNINKDPIFEKTDDSRYFHLADLNNKMESSPCINAGIMNTSYPQVDLFNVSRKQHGQKADMGAIEYITRGAELTATPEFGRNPLSVDLICKAIISSDNQSYTFSMDFGDGSKIMENSHGTFYHKYSGGEFNPECTIILKENPTIFSVPNTLTIDVSSFRWKFDTGGVIESSPAIGQDGTIFVGSDSGAMFAINPDGTQKWRFQTEGRIISSPAVYSNTVIFGSTDSYVYKVDASNGNKIWQFDTHGEVYSSPAIDKSGNIYIGSCDNKLYAITPDGDRKWAFFSNNRITSSPSIAYYSNNLYGKVINTIYIGSHDNHMYALNLETGTLQWSIDLGADVWGTPAISDDRTIYIAAAEVVGAANYLNLFALNPNGSIKWKHEMLRGAYASPILFSDTIKSQTVGMVLMGSYDNNLYGLSYSGNEEWAFPTRNDFDNDFRLADILSSPAIGSSGIIYFGSENHSIYAIDHEKGRIRWSYETEGPIYSSSVIHNNVLYVGSFDHYLYAIRTNDKSLSTSSPWPVYHQNSSHHSCITIDEDTMPPTVISTYPAHNETGLAANVPITLTVSFSKIMDWNTIDIAFESALETETLPQNKIQFEDKYMDDNWITVASFQPLSSTLEPDLRYKVKISGTAVDKKRNKLQGDWTWVFYSETDEEDGHPSGMRGCFIDTVLDIIPPFFCNTKML